jgi:hypothetical protein
MSGEKHVTVATSELARLRAAESRLRSLREDLPEVLRAMQRDAAEEIQRRIAPLEERQRAFRQAVKDLSEEISRHEEETAQRIEAQHRQTRRELDEAIRSMRGETRQLLQEQDRRLTGLITAEREARQREMAKVQSEMERMQSQIGDLVAAKKHAEQRAASWIKNAEAIRAFIEGHYRHQEFAPGELERLSEKLRQASRNFADHLPEVAVSGAQTAYQELSDLRVRLEAVESEWESCRGIALASAEKVLAEARANRQCRALDLQAKVAGMDVEVDYWTEGKLSALEEKAGAFVNRLKSARPGLSTLELRELVDKQFPGMRKELEQLIEEARIKVIASQVRANIADLVVQSLESKGYAVTEHTYEGNDMRGGFAAKLASRDNSEIVVLVSPDENDPGKNNLQIHSFDNGAYPAERAERASEIGEVLSAAGLEVGHIQEAALQPNPVVRDIKRIRERPRQVPQARQVAAEGAAKRSGPWNG